VSARGGFFDIDRGGGCVGYPGHERGSRIEEMILAHRFKAHFIGKNYN